MANFKVLWQEYLEDSKDLNLDSFELQDDLHPSFWKNNKLDSNIISNLKQIVDDFLTSLDIDTGLIDDITLTGSLANYNWSKFSDIDLHLLLDFEKIDENKELVRNYFNALTSNWNKRHNIVINGFEVEIYVQDILDPHHSTGVYSVKNNQWIAQPTKIEPKLDFPAIKKKAESLIDQIERAESMQEDGNNREAVEYADKLMDKIRKFRKSGLETGGEYSTENIAFKVLRRSGYIGVLKDTKVNAYDQMMSSGQNPEDFNKKIRVFIKKSEKTDNFAFNRLDEEEKYQKIVKKRHFRLKKANIGGGKQANTPPFTEKPSFKRGKYAPPGG